ncbi:hypothetical protein vBEcoMWL3_gp143 [Escherichia phage vB_EcoM_WL-3]|nr:hypothetical protein vBEcoMWL3_gp143 [Escherichia phage vB_EcoM_WL-3]
MVRIKTLSLLHLEDQNRGHQTKMRWDLPHLIPPILY